MLDLASTNRIGSQKGMALKVRNEPDPDQTIAIAIWQAGPYKSILYDPWCSNRNAQTVQGHYHTSWARNVFFNHRDNLFRTPARFDWKGKTVYLVGHGRSYKKNMGVLNSVERKNPAIFLNSAYNGVDVQPVDYVMIADNRILGTDDYRGGIKTPIISFPGIDRDILLDKFTGIFGFTPWTQAPLNNFMREIFPHLPPILDILTVSVMATHLALLNGASNVVYVGMDNTFKGAHKEKIKTKDIHGNRVSTIKTYYEMAIATCQLAGFARFHTDAKFWNATGAGILGVNYFEKETLFPWVKQITANEALMRFES